MVPIYGREGKHSVMQNGGTRTLESPPSYKPLQSQGVRPVSRPEEVGELGHTQNARGEQGLRRRRESKKREHREQADDLFRRVVALVARLFF